MFSLPQCIGNLLNLETLSVSHNFIQEIPVNISQIRNTINLYFSNNFIENIPNFEKNFKIGIFDVSLNKIISIEQNTFKNISVEKLFLSGNKISQIKEFPENLEIITINSNKIENINEIKNIFNLPKISFVDASNNDMKGNFDSTIQSFYLNLLGNNVTISNYKFGLPKKFYAGGANKTSFYECYSVYSSDELENSKILDQSITGSLLEISPENFEYRQCSCIDDYMVKKLFFFKNFFEHLFFLFFIFYFLFYFFFFFLTQREVLLMSVILVKYLIKTYLAKET